MFKKEIFYAGLAAAFLFQPFALEAKSPAPAIKNLIKGTKKTDILRGTPYIDTIYGYGGSDFLYGGENDDKLYGGSGNDTLHGGKGADLMVGGPGDDLYIVDNARDKIIEAGSVCGPDPVVPPPQEPGPIQPPIDPTEPSPSPTAPASGMKTTLSKSIKPMPGIGKFIPRSGVDHVKIFGNLDGYTLPDNVEVGLSRSKNNLKLTGNCNANYLIGGPFEDELAGLGGNDMLYGGRYADILTGGKGADVFVYLSPMDSLPTSGKSDTITDFNAAEGDVIDLSVIDADKSFGSIKQKNFANEAFLFIGTAPFSGTAGELRYENGMLSGDIDGNKTAEFYINVQNNGAPAVLGASAIKL